MGWEVVCMSGNKKIRRFLDRRREDFGVEEGGRSFGC